MPPSPIINKTLEFDDLTDPHVRCTALTLRHWLWRWLLSGGRLAVNGIARRRAYIRSHKMWEYARGLALTGAAPPSRNGGGPYRVLEVGGAMTATVLYLAASGDRVLSLDTDEDLTEQTNRAARERGLRLEARTIDLSREDAGPRELGGFDRIYSFSVIEHVAPPGQAALLRRLGRLLRPGGCMCITFDYGEDAPAEAPLRRVPDVRALCAAVDLPLAGNGAFVDTGGRYPLNRRHPRHRYTFGSLFFRHPEPRP